MVVKTPAVESQTDTLKMPTVTTSKDTITAVTPKLEVTEGDDFGDRAEGEGDAQALNARARGEHDDYCRASLRRLYFGCPRSRGKFAL